MITEEKQKNSGIGHFWSLGFVCFLAYTACYWGRGILSAMIPQILEQTSFTKESLGLMGSAFFFTYGIGQLINGFMGDFVKAKYMVALGLFLAGLVVCLFPLFESVLVMTILWGLCGLCCSMLWGPLSKVIAENTTERVGRIFMTLLTVASLVGTMGTYIIAIVASGGGWGFAFYLTGAFLIISAILWFISLGVLEKRGLVKYMKYHAEGEDNVFKIILAPSFLLMTMVALINGIIRNAVVFWIPTYITEKLLVSTTVAASISTFLPLVNLLGTFVGMWMLRRMHDNEEKVTMVMFAVSTLMFVLMFVLDGSLFFTTVLALFISSGAMIGASNMIFCIYCLRFTDTGRVSAITGLMNFTGYASASLASFIFTGIVETKGWNTTVASWAAISMVGGIFAYLAAKSKEKKVIPTSNCNYHRS